MNKKGRLIVVSGPSGVGKDTIVNEYLKISNDHLSISATTRKPREGEINNKDYWVRILHISLAILYMP